MPKRIDDITKQKLLSFQGSIRAAAKAAGVSFGTAYAVIKGRGQTEYLTMLAQRKGYRTWYQYVKSLKDGTLYPHLQELAEERQRRPENSAMAGAIGDYLEANQMPQAQLARELGISPTSVSEHARGRYLPLPELQKRILDRISPGMSLEKLVSDYSSSRK